MNIPISWQCPNCGEQHQAEYDVCWKCGSNPAGDRDAEFEITEPVTEEDQAPVPATYPFLDFQLPFFTYFCIPIYLGFLCFEFVETFISWEPGQVPQMLEFSPSHYELFGHGIACVTIFIPMVFTIFRLLFTSNWNFRTKRFKDDLLLWWYIIRLPKYFQKLYPWFSPIYYGAFVVSLIGPYGMLAWKLLLAGDPS